MGHAAWHVERLHRHLMAELKSSVRLFADETRMPVQAPGTGKTTSGQLWTYARDDSPWGGTAPPAVVYIYERDRKGCVRLSTSPVTAAGFRLMVTPATTRWDKACGDARAVPEPLPAALL
ncbi:transposase number 3 for insertion sequence (plasmid) [Sphingobium cloacae]|uniref:Transposase number 3 for insertion sequence n=1 Tax=Sphingobium cloacae TaxID=120107 RepID=A0A1E1F9A6_9SPHN|nr:transposase number 3 for insertion sequence [Sphingobium cloacae]